MTRYSIRSTVAGTDCSLRTVISKHSDSNDSSWNPTGIDGALYEKAYHDGEKEVAAANARAQASHIVGVPSMLVAGRYVTDVGKTGGQDNLIVLLDALLAKERDTRFASSGVR